MSGDRVGGRGRVGAGLELERIDGGPGASAVGALADEPPRRCPSGDIHPCIWSAADGRYPTRICARVAGIGEVVDGDESALSGGLLARSEERRVGKVFRS